MRILYIFLVVICTSLFLSCGEEESDNIFSSRVNFKINLINDKELTSPYGTKEFPVKEFPNGRLAGESVGYGGLLIVCSTNLIDNSTIFQPYAYDLACPYEKKLNYLIKPDKEGKAMCRECGSVYNIMSGNIINGSGIGLGLPISGPAAEKPQEFHLQSYPVIQLKSNIGTEFRVIHNN